MGVEARYFLVILLALKAIEVRLHAPGFLFVIIKRIGRIKQVINNTVGIIPFK